MTGCLFIKLLAFTWSKLSGCTDNPKLIFFYYDKKLRID